MLATYEVATISYKYVLQDAQGSTHAMLSNSGSTSAVTARHDSLPFGEEIGANVGSRTAGQMYGETETSRQKYAMTERDKATGLDHTPWRKYENLSGRWTSPDPYGGSMAIANPQSFNRYSYTQNDPVNFVDPSGLNTEAPDARYCISLHYTNPSTREGFWANTGICFGAGGGGPGGILGGNPQKHGLFSDQNVCECVCELKRATWRRS